MESARCKAFMYAADTGSFTKAAERLNYTPSGVSQLVGALENETGLTLLRRTRKGVTLTPDGEILLPAVREFLEKENRIYELAAEVKGLLVGSVTIAAYSSISTHWLPEVIRDFEQDYPTYPRVIDAFVSSYANTNCELLLYVKEDAFVPDKLAVLDRLFEQYADVDCYVNVYVGNLEDERGLFAQNDAYITNRSLDNVRHMDMADFYGIPVISSVNLPIFTEQDVQGMCKL